MNEQATPTTANHAVSFTATVKHDGSDRPFQNVQIGSGWKGQNQNRVRPEDVPKILNAAYEEISNRFNDMIDSSDEVGLWR